MPNRLTEFIEKSFILEATTSSYKTSFLVPVITFPITECYHNWRNVVVNEYRTRSLIRAICITSSFAAGAILILFGNASWFQTVAFALYSGLPILNQIPEATGMAISGSFIFSYFCAWLITLATNFFNHYKFGGAEHYLTPDKTQELLKTIKKNKFHISTQEIKEIFNKINLQLRQDPKNFILHDLITAFRKGDLQTVLDHAHLLEIEIALVNNKISVLSNCQQESAGPQEPELELSAASQKQELQHLQQRPIGNPPPPRNSLSEPGCDTEDLQNISSSSNRLTEPLSNAQINPALQAAQIICSNELELPTIHLPPAQAIIHQYKNKKIFTARTAIYFNRNVDINQNLYQQTIEQLQLHQEELKQKRHISPTKNFRISI